MTMPPIRRTIKNVVRNYSDAQVKVREATSNDPWGPSSTLMGEIADLTYNVVAFTEIMQMVWKRLNDHGKNWRHVYKSLVLLDYIIKTGSEKVAQQCRENIFAIQTLKDFQYIEDNKDQGINVREKAKQLVLLLKDDERLKNERVKSLKAKEWFAQNAMGIGSDNKVRYGTSSPGLSESEGHAGGGYTDPYGGAMATGYNESSSPVKRRGSSEMEQVRPSSAGEEELQLQLALAMSKEEHDEEMRKQKTDDIKLQMALDESRKNAVSSQKIQEEILKIMLPKDKNAPTDPWGVPLQKPATDPWGTPLPGPPGSQSKTTVQPPDPWVPSEKPVATPQPTDPWGGSTKESPAKPTADPWMAPPTNSSAPWESPVISANQQAAGFDSGFGTPMTTNGTSNNIDDGFDLIGSRKTSDSPAKMTDNNDLGSFDPLVPTNSNPQGSDPWVMSGMQQSLDQQDKKKTPRDFLGDNAALVNLDELVSKDSSSSNNPFAAPANTNNPFEQSASQRETLSQMQQVQYSSGFTQPSTSTLLPAPLLPVNTAQPPMQSNQQGYNPFLL
ncbi:hypothetical protein ScPMuIL_003577 [Solemya velum]